MKYLVCWESYGEDDFCRPRRMFETLKEARAWVESRPHTFGADVYRFNKDGTFRLVDSYDDGWRSRQPKIPKQTELPPLPPDPWQQMRDMWFKAISERAVQLTTQPDVLDAEIIDG